MSNRFRPPPLALFYASPDADHARALAAARDQGFAEGHAQGLVDGHGSGLAEGIAETRTAVQAELEALREICAKREAEGAVADALRRLLAGREADIAALEGAVRELAAVALRTLFPTLLDAAAGTEIARLLADTLADRAPEALTLRAHPGTLVAVAAETTGRHDERIVLAPDPGMPPGTADVTWTGGGLTFDPAALLLRITTALAPAPEPTAMPSQAADTPVPSSSPPETSP